MLHSTRELAERAQRLIDADGCCGLCLGRHVVVDLASHRRTAP
jgi:hypothetical protein